MAWQTLFPKFKGHTDTAFERAEGHAPPSLEIGRVKYVDYEQLLVDVYLVDRQACVKVSHFMTGDSSRAADVGSLPTVNSYVVVALIGKVGATEEWALMGSIKSGYRSGQALTALRESPQDPPENTLDRQISRKISYKEYQISVEAGGELLIDEGMSFLSSDLAEIKTDTVTETQVSNLHNSLTQSFNGRVQTGAAVRMLPDGSGTYAHPTGLSFEYVTPDGLDPAERYNSGTGPGLVATEELHVFHDTTDLIPDLLPQLHGIMPRHTDDVNAVSSLLEPVGDWKPVSSDRPPNDQVVTTPLLENRDRTDPNQKLYKSDLISIQHRRDLRYTHDSNLIGAFETDPDRYLSVLVPQINHVKFTTDFNHTQTPLLDPHPHTNFRLRVPVRSEYSPLLHNQTAYYQTKEGYQMWIMGATMDPDLNPMAESLPFEKGAGRSGEIYALGGLEATLGKTQDEEESLSLTAIGQMFVHIGADNGNNPHFQRSLQALDRITGKPISLAAYDFEPVLGPGNNRSYQDKTAAENMSLIMTTDGGVAARFGARHESVERKFVFNGTSDGQGTTQGSMDSHNAQRSIYGVGDSYYQFHDLSATTEDNSSVDPCDLGCVSLSSYDPDVHGRSWDFHLCSDWFMRVGKNEDSGTSWSMDTAGGLVWWLGADDNGRSLTIQTDGGAQIRLKADPASGEALNLYITGNVNEYIDGTVNRIIEGDLTETIRGSRTVQIEGSDTLLVAEDYSPVFNNYTLLCTGMGTMGFGLGLDITVQALGLTNIDLLGPITTTTIAGQNIINVGGNTIETFLGGVMATAVGPYSLNTNSMMSLKAGANLSLIAPSANFTVTGPFTISGSPLALSGVSSVSGTGPVAITTGGPLSIESSLTRIT